MKLRRFEVDGFAQIKHLEMTFADNVPNLILGPNETGKSHLMQALLGVLFGLQHPDQFKPWSGQDVTTCGVLEFDDEDGRQVRLERDFATNAVSVAVDGERPWMMKTGPRARLAETERYLACLERWLGFCAVDVFTATTFIHQTDVMHAGLEGMSPQLKRLITGSGDVDYEHALADLRHQLDTLRHPPGRTSPRPLEQKEQELLELEAAFEEGLRLQDRLTSLQQQQERLSQAIVAREAMLTQKRSQLERFRSVVERERELARLEVEFEGLTTRMNQFVAAHERIERARIVREKVAAAEGVDLVTLLELEHAVRLAHQRLEIAREQAAHMPAWVHIGTWLIAALGALIGVVLALLVSWLLLVLLLMLLIVGAFVAWRLGFYAQEQERRTPAVIEAEQSLKEARTRRTEVLDRLGVGTVEETLTLRKTYEFSDRALDKAQAALLALGDEKQISERYQQVSVRLTSLRYRLADALRADDELRALGTPENRVTYCESLEEQVHTLERSVTELRQGREAVERELLSASVDEPDIPVLFHQIRALRKEIDLLCRRRQALELAVETLENSVTEFRQQTLGLVAEDASNLLQIISDGRYTRLTLSPQELEPFVDTPDRTRIARSGLSREEQDQVYVALRVALAGALAGGKHLPIVLDDPYVNLDPERVARTVELMRSLAPHRQVILFTCNPQYEDWFKPVLRLSRNSPAQCAERRAIS